MLRSTWLSAARWIIPSMLLILHQLQEAIEVTDIHLNKLVVRLVLDVFEVGKVAGISEFVKVDDVVLRVFVDEQAYNMGAYETGTAGDYDVSLHSVIS